MTLQEMSRDCIAQNQAIRARIRILRAEAKEMDELGRFIMQGRIRKLGGLARESWELAQHLEHYYERGYSRNGKYTL